MLTQSELHLMGQRHWSVTMRSELEKDVRHRVCATCHSQWPCDAAKLLAHVRESMGMVPVPDEDVRTRW